MGELLRLMAEDASDLEIISAAAQDALLRMGEVRFDAKARRFSALVNRFRWEAADSGRSERVRSGLSFESVLRVRSKRVRTDAPGAFAAILSIGFSPDPEPPGGVVRLMLAGGGEIALNVECIDAVLTDMGEAWRTPRRPDHDKP